MNVCVNVVAIFFESKQPKKKCEQLCKKKKKFFCSFGKVNSNRKMIVDITKQAHMQQTEK